MSKLRSQGVKDADGTALDYATALYLIRDSVAKRRGLIHGQLHDGYGSHCAIGAFWTDNPKAVLTSALIDEVAAVNDSVPPSATAKERWKKVNSWLRFKLATLRRK